MPLHPTHFLSFAFVKFKIFILFSFLSEILVFSKFPNFLIYHQSGQGITFFMFYHIHINLQHTLDKIFFTSSRTSSSKNLSTRPNLVFSSPFFAGPSLASLAIVSVLCRAGGKPSTWFPPVGLVELYFPSNSTLHKFNSITKI